MASANVTHEKVATTNLMLIRIPDTNWVVCSLSLPKLLRENLSSVSNQAWYLAMDMLSHCSNDKNYWLLTIAEKYRM